MVRGDRYVTVFWAVLGLFVAVYSSALLGLGEINSPGPGLFPFVVGAAFFLLALLKLFLPFLGFGATEEPQAPADGRLNYPRLSVAVASLFLYGVFLESVGFLIVSFAALAVLFRNAGYRRWTTASGYAAIVVAVTYVMFTYLGTRFPAGLLRHLGLY